jgi:hypothetical protein
MHNYPNSDQTRIHYSTPHHENVLQTPTSGFLGKNLLGKRARTQKASSVDGRLGFLVYVCLEALAISYRSD